MEVVDDYKSKYALELKLEPWQRKDSPNIKSVGDVLNKTPHELYQATKDSEYSRQPRDTMWLLESAIKTLNKEDSIFLWGRKVVTQKFLNEQFLNPQNTCKLVEILVALENLSPQSFKVSVYDSFKSALQTEIDKVVASRNKVVESKLMPMPIPPPGKLTHDRIVLSKSDVEAAMRLIGPRQVRAQLKRILDAAQPVKPHEL